MKEEICVGGELLAIVVKDVGSYDSDQINFFTDGSLPLQAGVFNRPKTITYRLMSIKRLE